MKKGFTLIEILVSIVIFAIAILMSAGSVVISSRMMERVEAMRQVQDETRYLAEFITREISSATNIVVEKPVGANPFFNCSYLNCDTITIERPNRDGNGNFKETISPSMDGDQVLITINSSSPQTQVVNSQTVKLRKLKFKDITPVAVSGKVVEVELALQERPNNRTSLESSNKKLNALYKPTTMELRFIASNLSSVTKAK